MALVILGSTGLMLFSWINNNMVTNSRLKDAEQRAQWQLEGQAWLSTLNPSQKPDGDIMLGALRLTWRSELVEPMRDEFDFRGSLSPRWRLGLYRVKAQMSRVDSASRIEWQQLVAGWRPRTSADAPPPGAAAR